MSKGGKGDPREMAREWKKNIRHERFGIDRSIRQIETKEAGIKQKVKQLMKQGHADAAMPLIQSLVESRKARTKLTKTGVQLDSLMRQIDLQVAQVRVTGCFSESADVMHALNVMMNVPEMQQVAQNLQREMERAGLVSDMTDEIMEEVTATEDPENEAVAVRMIYNEIASEVQKATGKEVPRVPISQSEIDADPEASRLAHA